MITDQALLREFFYVSIGSIILITFLILLFVQRIKRESNRVTSYALHINSVIDSTIPDILDSMCEECLNDYLVLNGETFGLLYINDDTERKIQKEVLEMLFQRISPAFLDKLSLYYNPNAINDIITRKIVILVTAYVVQINQTKDNKKETT